MICVISIVDSISETSMPINEFVIYRSRKNYSIKQILIVCDGNNNSGVEIPNDVECHFVNHNIKQIRKVVKQIVENEGKNNVVFHAHHQKSALAFMIGTIGLKIRRRCIFTVHSTYSERSIKYKLSSCVCSLWAEVTNCVSKSAYLEYSKLVKKIKKDRFIYITNGVDVERIDSILKLNDCERNLKTLICVGRMIPLKNHEYLVRLLSELPDMKMIFVGAEDENKSIRKMAEKMGVKERIDFMGLVPRNEVFKLLSSSGIYVSASYIEGMPVSVLEAMRAGVFPIISDIQPHREIKEVCPLIEVLPLDEKIWKEKIEFYSNMNVCDYNKLSNDIKEAVKNKFSLDIMHEKYLLIYKEMLKK